jgi:hypothetical protein
LAHSLHYSLIECEPLTGRKHQIRRHAKLAGNPVAGDRRYGSVRSLSYLRRHLDFNRLGLHAHALTLTLPGDDYPTRFQSGGLPDPMRLLLEKDRTSPVPTALPPDPGQGQAPVCHAIKKRKNNANG